MLLWPGGHFLLNLKGDVAKQHELETTLNSFETLCKGLVSNHVVIIFTTVVVVVIVAGKWTNA